MAENHFYIGIDIDDENAVVSYCNSTANEPETFSMVAGSEAYLIPVAVIRKGDQWVVGSEAETIWKNQNGTGRQNLVSGSCTERKIMLDEREYRAEELLSVYVRRLISLVTGLGKTLYPDYLVFTLEKISAKTAAVFGRIAKELKMRAENVILLERTESFYYFAYNQKHELWMHDICLFDFRKQKLQCSILTRNSKTIPQVVSSLEQEYDLDEGNLDESFAKTIENALEKRICSAVYLTGDGFDGKWMKKSTGVLCRGRRAFAGKNLYAKGSCYAAMVKDGQTVWPYVYMGANAIKVNVSLKVKNNRKTEFLSLIDAGEKWYDISREYEVITETDPVIDLWLQFPYGRNAKIEKLELSDFPERPLRMSRLRIGVSASSDTEVRITIKDLGFGELMKGTSKIWEYTMTL